MLLNSFTVIVFTVGVKEYIFTQMNSKKGNKNYRAILEDDCTIKSIQRPVRETSNVHWKNARHITACFSFYFHQSHGASLQTSRDVITRRIMGAYFVMTSVRMKNISWRHNAEIYEMLLCNNKDESNLLYKKSQLSFVNFQARKRPLQLPATALITDTESWDRTTVLFFVSSNKL